MISHIPSKTLGPALLLISSGILLSTNSALAAQPMVDLQELARQFILARPVAGSPADSNTKPTTGPPASRGNLVDPQEQARRFILAKPEFGSAIDSNVQMTAANGTSRKGHADPQELVRQFILARPSSTSAADQLSGRRRSAPSQRFR